MSESECTYQHIQVSRLNSSLDYYGYGVNTGTLAAVTDGSLMTLSTSASVSENAYAMHKITIGGETRNVVKYSGATRQVREMGSYLCVYLCMLLCVCV